MGYYELDGVTYHDGYFTKEEVMDCFRVIDGKRTLAELDVKDVFHNQIPSKGIVGNVIEQSLLGMKADSKQEADIKILQEDGKTYYRTEIKSTGVIESKKEGQKYEAKEPASITAVSIGHIEHETFDKSHFYDKIKHLLFVFYHYDRYKISKDGSREYQKVVPYAEYDRFQVLGYKFFDLLEDKAELEKFKNDWTQVRDCIIEMNKASNPELLYPMLHSRIKDSLFYIDIAPRYRKRTDTKSGQTPRIRFKKSYVNTIFQNAYNESIGKPTLEKLPTNVNSLEELNKMLHELASTYKNWTVDQLIDKFQIKVEDRGKLSKQVCEQIMVRMLGGTSKKISNIELFEKIGVIAKSITKTQNDKKTEDTKFFTLNLEEIENQELEYEETEFYQYFSEHKLLCIMFEEPSRNARLNDNRFLGFKWFTFSEEIINTTIKDVYDIICDRINNCTLVESYEYKKDGTQIFNKTGVPKTKLNFPKSKDYDYFVRGTSSDSTQKPWKIKGQAVDGGDFIYCYSQQIWMHGGYLVKSLKKIDFV